MGWLKELMRDAQPAVSGYGQLARMALEHSEWPDDTRPKPRSLAALFSKLDRGLELEWLVDRPAVQQCLSLVLGAPLAAVQQPLAARPTVGPGRRLRFDDLPFGRAFELTEEPLPPGFPPEVAQPASWTRLWWVAPSGSGRSLVGLWLRARALAEVVTLEGFRPALLPGTQRLDRVPLYLEVERAAGLESLWQHPPLEPLCIAAPQAPPPGAGFHVVTAPPAEALLPKLTAWVERRLPEDGSFDAASAGEWLAPCIAAGKLRTFGALLGACGMLDALGIAHARGRSLDELAEKLVAERLTAASRNGSSEASWLRQFGFDALIQMAQSALADDEFPWDGARTQDEWLALVPQRLREGVDADWLRWSLSRAAGQTTVRELERALERSPPGAYRIVRALMDSGLLRKQAEGHRLRLAPDLLREVTRDRARRMLVGQSTPAEWGAALLGPNACEIAEVLFERFERNDFTAIDELLELELDDRVELVAALEACFCGLGLRALAGADIPLEYVTPVWNEAVQLLVELPGQLPRNRVLELVATAGIAAHSPAHSPAMATGDPATLFRLAALALSERLPPTVGLPHPVLRPWHDRFATGPLIAALDAIHASALEAHGGPEWPLQAFALAGRLRAVGVLGDAEPHPLARPSALVHELPKDELPWSWVAKLGAHALEFAALRHECKLAAVEWPRMARALWQAFERAGRPSEGDALFSSSASAARWLWPHVPPALLPRLLLRYRNRGADWSPASLSASHWEALLAELARSPDSADGATWLPIVEALPPTWARKLWSEETLFLLPPDAAEQLLEALWRRFPELLLEYLRSATPVDGARLSRVLDSAPPEHAEGLMQPLREMAIRPGASRTTLDAARSWLSRQVHERSSHWRSAYALLAQLEKRIARARRASPRES